MEKLIGEFSVGLFFWQSILFLALVFLLRKFAWKPILNAVIEREEKIEGALKAAEEAEKRMQTMNAENEELLKKTREERDLILKDARETKETILSEAKTKAKEEAEKIMTTAHEAIQSEKTAAMAELKSHVATLSIEVAEKIIRQELKSKDQQKKIASQLAEEMNLN